MRAFIAVDLTDEIRKGIAEIQSAMAGFSSQVRWVQPESIHLTLKFLGEISVAQQQQVTESCTSRRSGIQPFTMSVGKTGFFPNVRAPRVFWLGIEEGQADLQSLAQFIDDSMKSLGFEPEDRPFSPHVTIARIKYLHDPKAFADAAARFSEREFGSARVEEFYLYESRLTREGAIYTKRATFRLE